MSKLFPKLHAKEKIMRCPHCDNSLRIEDTGQFSGGAASKD